MKTSTENGIKLPIKYCPVNAKIYDNYRNDKEHRNTG